MKYSRKSLLAFGLIFCFELFSGHRAFSLTDETTINLENRPHYVTIALETNQAVITNEKDSSVTCVDLGSLMLFPPVGVGKSPAGVVVDSLSRYAVISNVGDNTVSTLDMDTQRIISTIKTGKSPRGIVFNPANQTALVADFGDDKVSKINLTAFSNAGSIPVGRGPIDVAVDPLLNIALVVNRSDNSVSVIDLAVDRVIKTVAVGKDPISIAINPEAHLAVVANEKDNSVTVIDLITWNTALIPVGTHPVAVAFNQADNRALVICDEDRSLLILDVDSNSVSGKYELNKRPTSVAINNYTNAAVVTDDKTDSLTLIRLPNPTPQIISVTPSAAFRGTSFGDIVIKGNKFVKASKVYFENDMLETTFIDNHNLEAKVAKDHLLRAGTFKITVITDNPGGGISNSVDFRINNPLPTISATEPQTIAAGSRGLVLSVFGSGFFEDTTAYVDGLWKSVAIINRSKMEVFLTAQDLLYGKNLEVKVSNPSPGGGESLPLMLNVISPLEIKIVSPTDGEIISASNAIIKGSFKSDSKDVGIAVNGVIADTVGTNWAANVPLNIGANKITATINDNSGNSVISTIAVSTPDTTSPLKLSANVKNGLAPLQIAFSAVFSGIPQMYEMDFEGDGIIDYKGADFEGMVRTYTQEGVYYPTLSIKDAEGKIYSDKIAITVLSKAEMTALLGEKWERAKDALTKGDIDAALRYFTPRSQEKYKLIFSALKDQLSSIMATLVAFSVKDIYENIAVHDVTANENGALYSYPGVLIRGDDGIWRFKDF